MPSSSRRLPIWLPAIALVALLPGVAAPRAEALNCVGDPWADGDTWDDNWWVGWYPDQSVTCDLNGQYTVAIQRINWGMGYRRSSVDGQYGWGTHNDVISFQAYMSITQDGMVGPGTWTKYRSVAIFRYWDGSLRKYGSPGYAASYVHLAKDTAASPNRWYNTNIGHTYFTEMDMDPPHA